MRRLQSLDDDFRNPLRKEELYLAGVDIIEDSDLVYGKLKEWDFRRSDERWEVSVIKPAKGLPLEVAIEMNEREHPLQGDNFSKRYGGIIRVTGYFGGADPREWADYDMQTLLDELERIGVDSEGVFESVDNHKNKVCELREKGTINLPSFVNSYNIDTQIGLNEFARVLREDLE